MCGSKVNQLRVHSEDGGYPRNLLEAETQRLRTAVVRFTFAPVPVMATD